MPGITYDTGALIAAERNNRRIWALHRRALEQGDQLGIWVELQEI